MIVPLGDYQMMVIGGTQLIDVAATKLDTQCRVALDWRAELRRMAGQFHPAKDHHLSPAW